MPERVEAMAIVSGAPPIAELRDRSGLLPLYNWLLAASARWRPGLLRVLFHIARPFASDEDAAFASGRFCSRSCSHATRTSCAMRRPSKPVSKARGRRGAHRSTGVMIDAEIYARPWGFPLEEVRVPVRLWHGTKGSDFFLPAGRAGRGASPELSGSVWSKTPGIIRCRSGTSQRDSRRSGKSGRLINRRRGSGGQTLWRPVNYVGHN